MKIRQTERDGAKLCPTSGSGTSPYRQSSEFYFQPLCYVTGILGCLPSISWQLWEATTCLMTHICLPSKSLSALVGLGKGWSGAVLCNSPSKLLAVGCESQSITAWQDQWAGRSSSSSLAQGWSAASLFFLVHVYQAYSSISLQPSR